MKFARPISILGLVIGVSIALGTQIHVLGSATLAIVIGTLLSTRLVFSVGERQFLRVIAKVSLQVSIVVLGLDLSLSEVASVGLRSVPVLAGTIFVALVGQYFIGRKLAIAPKLRNLIGVGTAICGASAIAATDSVIRADDDQVSYAMTTIFTFNVIAAVFFPIVGHIFHMNSQFFSTWAGSAINDLSSVVAAASSFGHQSASLAVIVKLTRTLAIIPITFVLARQTSGRSQRVGTREIDPPKFWGSLRSILPVFVLWFIGAVALNSLGLVPHQVSSTASDLGIYVITVALGAIGLSSSWAHMKREGYAPLALGAILWVLVSSTSLIIQGLVGSG